MTTSSTVNGLPLLECQLTELSSGNWTLDAWVQTEEPPDAEVIVDLSGVELRGTIVRGNVNRGVWAGRIEGGKGGIRTALPARYYVSQPAKVVLADIAADSGEVLSQEIPTSILGTSLPSWTRVAGPTSRGIGDLAAKLGVNWRVLRSGEIWLGPDREEPNELDHVLISQGPADAATVAPQTSPSLVPGDLFLDRPVADVMTLLTPSRLEQTAYFRGTDEPGRVMRVFERLIDRLVGRRLDYSGVYPARVVSQAGDGTLELLPDDPRLRGDGLKRVPIRLGLPGTRCEVAAGARVRVGFDNQDPSLPWAGLWDTNPADVTVIEVGTGGDFAALAGLVDANFAQIADMFSSWTVVAMDGGAALKTLSGDLSFSPVACEKVRTQ
jgi:hypothetical protein